MTNNVATTCFTDIEDSAALTEKLGNTVFGEMRHNYFAVCEALAQQNVAINIKNTGDGHMITFKDIESPLKFASQLQSFYRPQPNYVESPLKFRIGLFLGVIEEQGTMDAFGSGVNRASRVESNTPAGSVWVNDDFLKSITVVWGEPKAKQLFSDQGDIQVKKLPPMKLYSFDWQSYTRQYPENGLPALVRNHLENASVIVWNLPLSDISGQPPVIWPVVPRDGVNAIHCGQLAIIRLLAMLGSPINVLIADCGATANPTREYSENFKKKIDSFSNKIGIRNVRYDFMTDMFSPGCESCQDFHRHFQKVISQLTLEKLVAANNKDYSEAVKEAIKQAPTLDFLKPALTISSILHLSKREGRKCIVVVGHDERILWQGAHYSIPDTVGQFGVLFNPILKMKEGAQVHQTERIPLYYSWDQIVEDMEKYDLANWLTKLHLFLSSFPAASVVINDVSIKPADWLDGKSIEEKIDKAALARQVFTNILTC